MDLDTWTHGNLGIFYFSILRVVSNAQRWLLMAVNCDVNNRIKATWCTLKKLYMLQVNNSLILRDYEFWKNIFLEFFLKNICHCA